MFITSLIVDGMALLSIISPAYVIPPPERLQTAPERVLAPQEEVLVVETDWKCSCVKGLRYLGVDVPRMDADEFVQNTTPFVGAVAIFELRNRKTGEMIRHVEEVTEIKANGFWSRGYNRNECAYSETFTEWSSDNLIGFYKYNKPTQAPVTVPKIK